jgi:hypothetical protein
VPGLVPGQRQCRASASAGATAGAVPGQCRALCRASAVPAARRRSRTPVGNSRSAQGRAGRRSCRLSGPQQRRSAAAAAAMRCTTAPDGQLAARAEPSLGGRSEQYANECGRRSAAAWGGGRAAVGRRRGTLEYPRVPLEYPPRSPKVPPSRGGGRDERPIRGGGGLADHCTASFR